MLKKPYLKVQILLYKFWDWKGPPPLSELFRKFIRFGRQMVLEEKPAAGGDEEESDDKAIDMEVMLDIS